MKKKISVKVVFFLVFSSAFSILLLKNSFKPNLWGRSFSIAANTPIQLKMVKTYGEYLLLEIYPTEQPTELTTQVHHFANLQLALIYSQKFTQFSLDHPPVSRPNVKNLHKFSLGSATVIDFKTLPELNDVRLSFKNEGEANVFFEALQRGAYSRSSLGHSVAFYHYEG